MRVLQPADAAHRHDWHSVVWGYWCAGCHCAVLDSDIRTERSKSAMKTPIHIMLDDLGSRSTTWIDDLDWWTNR